MTSVLTEFYRFLDKKNKELLIRQTGSTKEDSNERVRSGQSYLYQQYIDTWKKMIPL